MRKTTSYFNVLVAWLLMCMVSVQMMANPITREQARKKVTTFQKMKGDSKVIKAVVNEKRLSPKRAASATAYEPYYVFDRGENEGFIIASGDDQTIEILGYTDNGNFDYEQLPPQLQDMLNDYARQIQAIQAGAPVNRLPANHPKVEPFMACKWSQGSPYNLLCPLDGGSRSVTGCVATAMAQILYYNREKSVTETTAAIPGFTTYTKGIQVPGIPAGSPIDWDNMKDTYGSASELQKQAVAQLMLYCGVSVEMDYTSSSSGAQIYKVAEACKKYFGYGNSVKHIDSFSSEDEMDQTVYNELAAGRPVYLGGYTGDWSVGHAFLTCGYENQRYWINWGWGGQSDGYYYLSNLTPGDGQGIGGSSDGYNSGRNCIIGFEPENFGEKAMSFSDTSVKTICIQRWDANGDGKLTYGEAAAITDLGDAFTGNTSIKKFPELYYFTAVTTLPDDAFNGCVNMNTLRLPKKLKSIGARALKDCKKLTQLNLPTGVNAIGEEAFSGCALLTPFELPNEMTAIRKGTFKNCAQFTEVNLPISISSIGDEAFAGCTHLTSFTVNTFHPDIITLGTSVFGNVDLSKATLHVMQGTKTFFETAQQWKDFGIILQTRDISEGRFSTLEAGNTYYLYNVGTGRYLTKGEAYNTQAVVGTTPMRFKAVHPSTKPEGVYYFTSPDTGNSGKYLFRTKSDPNVGNGVKACFVDGTQLTNAYWSIQEAGDMIYTIQIPADDATYVAGEFLGVQTDHATNAATTTYGAYYDVDYNSHALNCQWQLVLYDEAVAERFNEAQALEKLIATAKKRNVSYEEEQAVFDNLESTLEEIAAAQSSLRKKLKFMEFYHKEVRTECIKYFDSDTDGELSYKEASEVSDFGWLFSFMNYTSLVKVEELQYFTHVLAIPGNFMQGCTNLETVILPEGLEKIYYYAFKGCRKLKAINIPEYVNVIGDEAFEGCTALREVNIANPNPASINMGSNVFKNVPLAQCTLYVPFGSKALYAEAPVWKDFGTIIEIRGAHAQPVFSPITTDQPGYIYNIGTRMMLTMGEAYGTQSIVAQKGRLYRWVKNTGDTYTITDNITDNVVFRTNTDTKVGSGVKACFGDGSLSAKAYWTVEPVADNIYALHVPASDATYVEGDYLGIDESHQSDVASPTHGIYWDIKGITPNSQWAFVTEEDYKAAQAIDDVVAKLKKNLATAKAQEIDVTDEQAVCDNPQSTLGELQEALVSVRAKLHFITFQDSKVMTLCITNWDADGDGELTFEEAQAVTDIGETFRGADIIYFEEFKYFTSLTSIPDNAFRNASDLQILYLPASITQISSSAFTACSTLEYLVILNDQMVLPCNFTIRPQTTYFVPGAVLAGYQADESWTDKKLTEYTGKPVVTAEATRIYGRSMGIINPKVLGAPVIGTPETACESMAIATLPVGTYPITVMAGTITTPNVELREGVLTITPAPLTITANSYTRNVGEPNPEFELTYKSFRNKETDTVFVVRPVIECDATIDSPAGEYEIRVSGAEAQNYEITYVNGTLTVINPTGINALHTSDAHSQEVFDLQGHRVNAQLKKGLYIKRHKKIVVR